MRKSKVVIRKFIKMLWFYILFPNRFSIKKQMPHVLKKSAKISHNFQTKKTEFTSKKYFKFSEITLK